MIKISQQVSKISCAQNLEKMIMEKSKKKNQLGFPFETEYV